MDFLHSEIGSAKDNSKSPIHNWYKFTAGFSYKFVEQIINLESLKTKKSAKIFDPFAGCGTTLVSSQKEGIFAVGNEGQEFMYNIIRAKLNWWMHDDEFETCIQFILSELQNSAKDSNQLFHPLLKTLYRKSTLFQLYAIRDAIMKIKSSKYQLFFQLALSQTLHKVSKYPIAIPYIARGKPIVKPGKAWNTFEKVSRQMLQDSKQPENKILTSRVYLHDSRKENKNIRNNSCNICITSPPYLNNLDYGEVSKVHTHFFEITKSWNDITNKVRKNLVTGATTHYVQSDFHMQDFVRSEFYCSNIQLGDYLLNKAALIQKSAKRKSGKKTFDFLTLLYFQDMYLVLKEIKRVLTSKGTAYLILGDSAPYNVHIPTTEILGEMGQAVGFKDYKIHKIRTRGMKWKTLTHRHSQKLNENVLILR